MFVFLFSFLKFMILLYLVGMKNHFPSELSVSKSEKDRVDYCSYMVDYLKQFNVKIPDDINKNYYYIDDDLSHIPDGVGSIEYCSDTYQEDLVKSKIFLKEKAERISESARNFPGEMKKINDYFNAQIDKNISANRNDIAYLFNEEKTKSEKVIYNKYKKINNDEALSEKWNFLLEKVIDFFIINLISLIDHDELDEYNLRLIIDQGYIKKSSETLLLILEEYNKINKKFFLVDDDNLKPYTDSIGNIFMDKDFYLDAANNGVEESIMVHEIMHIVVNFLDIASFPGTNKSFDNLMSKNEKIIALKKESAYSPREHERMSRVIDSKSKIVSYYYEDDDVEEVWMDMLTFSYIGRESSIKYLIFLEKYAPKAIARYSNSGFEKFHGKIVNYQGIKEPYGGSNNYSMDRLYPRTDDLFYIFLKFRSGNN